MCTGGDKNSANQNMVHTRRVAARGSEGEAGVRGEGGGGGGGWTIQGQEDEEGMRQVQCVVEQLGTNIVNYHSTANLKLMHTKACDI